MVDAIPEGYSTLTPHIITNDTAAAIEFYKRAFGAEELFRMPGPGGQGVMHAELQIGNSRLMMCDEFPGAGMSSPKTLGSTCLGLALYVKDADAAFKQAVEAGCEVIMPVAEQFWGDRYGKVRDPFGHQWAFMTHVKDLSPEEIAAAAEEFFKNMPDCGGHGG